MYLLAIASGLCEYLLLDKTAALFPQTPGNSHLTDIDNTKHSDLTGVDNGNKRVLPYYQDGQTWFCFLRIASIARRVIQHKGAAPGLSTYHYPFQLPDQNIRDILKVEIIKKP